MTYALTTLDNGLRVASETIDDSLTAAFAIAVDVGARHETRAQGGLSHLLEHMAFKGTPRFNAKQIAEAIDLMGGNVNASHYAAAKSAISGLTKSWARELASFNILVNAVAPGFIVTGMTMGSNTPENIAERSKRMPLGRFVEPIEISYVVAWLASAETAMMTGQVISPNSGEVIVGY